MMTATESQRDYQHSLQAYGDELAHMAAAARGKILAAALFAAMYFGLAHAYTTFWQPLFAYTGFIKSYSASREIEALAIIIAAAAATPVRYKRPSDIYIAIAVLTTLIPTAVMYVYGGLSPETMHLTFLGIGVIWAARNFPIFVPNLSRLGSLDATWPVTILALFGVAIAAHAMGTNDFSFALFDVYGRRQISSEKITGFASYLVSFGITASSLAIILSLQTRNRITLVLNLVAAALYFGFIGHKAPLFTLPVILCLNSALRRKNIITYLVITFAVLIGVIAALCHDQSVWFTENGLPNTLFDFASTYERRGLILPAWVNDAYISYFGNHEKLYWAYSRLSFGLVPQTLPFEPQVTIGYTLDQRGMYANAGFVGSGYMNAGAAGVFAYAVLIGLCVRAIDTFAERNDTKVFATLICLPGFTSAVTSSEVPTELLTHGWAVAILLVAVSRARTRLRPGMQYALD